MLIVLFYSLLIVSNTASTKKAQETVNFDETIDELAILGRIVNAIAIEEKVKAGTLNRKDVIRELLNYKKTLTLESLTNANLMGLPDELKTLVSVVENQCKEKDGPCRGLGIVSKGIEAVESIGKLEEDIGEIFDERSLLVLLVSLQKASSSIGNLKTKCESLSQNIAKVKSANNLPDMEMNFYLFSIKNDLEEITNFPNSLKLKYTADQKNSLEAKNIKGIISTILKFETIDIAFSKKNIDIVVWSKSLKDLENVLKALKASFSEHALKGMDAKMLILVDVNDDRSLPVQDKKETFGFHDGAKDLTKISVDLTSDFVINIVMNGTSVEELKKLFPHAIALEKDMKPITETKSSMKSRNVALAVKNINERLSSAKTQVNRFDSIEKIFECYGGISEKLSVSTWQLVLNKIDELKIGNEFKDFAQKLDDVSFKVEELAKFLRIFSIEGKEVEEFNKFNDIGAVKKELDEFKVSLEGLIQSDGILSQFFAAANELEVEMSKTSNMLQNTKSASLPQCINNKEILANAKKVFKNLKSLSHVLVLNSDNKDIAAISVAVNDVKKLVSEWEKLEASTTTKSEQDAKTTTDGKTPAQNQKSLLNLAKSRIFDKRSLDEDGGTSGSKTSIHEIGHITSRDFNLAVEILSNLRNVILIEDLLNSLLDHDTEINESIRKSSNLEARKNLEKWWNTDTKDTLKRVSLIADVIGNKTFPKPNTLNGYTNVFETQIHLDNLVFVDMKSLIVNLVAINSTFMDPKSEEKLLNLYSNFAHANSILKSGQLAYSAIVLYFSKFSFSTVSDLKTFGNTTGTGVNGAVGMSKTMIGGIIGGSFVLLVVLGMKILSPVFKFVKRRRNQK